MLKYSADRVPILLILSLTILDFVMYFTIETVWLLLLYFIVMILPKACICAWNHHHQHTLTFNWMPLNRLLELFYALHSGVTTHLWLLHHVLGHHKNYLDQTKDESRWKRKDGTTMGVIEYTLNVALTSYYRGYLVGKGYPKLYRTHVIYTIVTIFLVAILTFSNPLNGMILFVIPMIVGLLITSWATYDHHAGIDETEDHFKASYNNLNKALNVVTGNLGYHTAHHYKQGVHWSELPKLHEEIKHLIPPELYHDSNWGFITSLSIWRKLGLPN